MAVRTLTLDLDTVTRGRGRRRVLGEHLSLMMALLMVLHDCVYVCCCSLPIGSCSVADFLKLCFHYIYYICALVMIKLLKK